MGIIICLQELAIVRSFHLHRSNRDDWIDACFWLLSTIFAGLMPIWLPTFLLSLFSQRPPLNAFTENGEFALISASLLSASLYIVTRESRWNFLRELLGTAILGRGRSFPNQRLFIFLSLILTLFCAGIFMGALVAKVPGVGLILNAPLVHWLSLILFGVTLFISFFLTVVENAFTNRPPVSELWQEPFEELRGRFKTIQEDE